MIWDAETGKQIGKSLSNHRQWITYLCWQPLHLYANKFFNKANSNSKKSKIKFKQLKFRDGESRYLASSSKDTTIKIWDTIMGTCVRSLTSHTQSVTCIKWGGKNLIYSASQDRTIKVWRSEDVKIEQKTHIFIGSIRPKLLNSL